MIRCSTIGRVKTGRHRGRHPLTPTTGSATTRNFQGSRDGKPGRKPVGPRERPRRVTPAGSRPQPGRRHSGSRDDRSPPPAPRITSQGHRVATGRAWNLALHCQALSSRGRPSCPSGQARAAATGPVAGGSPASERVGTQRARVPRRSRSHLGTARRETASSGRGHRLVWCAWASRLPLSLKGNARAEPPLRWHMKADNPCARRSGRKALPSGRDVSQRLEGSAEPGSTVS